MSILETARQAKELAEDLKESAEWHRAYAATSAVHRGARQEEWDALTCGECASCRFNAVLARISEGDGT